MLNKDSTGYIFGVALALCVACSIVVSAAAVVLRPIQEVNKAADVKRAILAASGVLQPGVSVDEQFANVRVRLVDFETGKFTDAVPMDEYDQSEAADDPALSVELADADDPAKVGRRERYAKVYFVNSDQGEILVMPIRGYGLWSTMYGFIALEQDYNTVRGIGFYEHGETPGLGGEIDNPRWKALWEGKQLFNDAGEVVLTVIKGSVNNATPNPEFKVDGLSGATLTSRGVANSVEFWFGPYGYGPFLTNLKNGEA